MGQAQPVRVAAIVNPVTRAAPREIAKILRSAAPSTVQLELLTTRATEDAALLAEAASEWADMVIAVGGDGTVAAVATGLVGRSTPLAIVPVGSTNVIAKELGLPRRARDAASLAFRSPYRLRRDVGRCGDRCFLHMAGAGFDSRFFERTNRQLKRRVGWFAYLPAALAALQLPPSLCAIDADGELIEAVSSLILVANGASIITPTLRLHDEIVADDGWLDLLVFTATSSVAIAQTLAAFAASRLAESPHVVVRKVKRVGLQATPDLSVQLDGDVVERTPSMIEIEPSGIDIVAPRPIPPT